MISRATVLLELSSNGSDSSEYSGTTSTAAAPTAAVLHYPQPPVSSSGRRGCRCGSASINPGKLTCCGQRCPCYVAGSSCAKCRCKGCRNPIDKITQIWSEALQVGGHESAKSGTDGKPPKGRTHVVHILQVDHK
ncbi:E3 ubiquitin-protein ligase MSL2-like isoform X2 [Amblyomma americanum]